MPSASSSRPGAGPGPSASSSSGPDPVGWIENLLSGEDGQGPSSTTKQMVIGGVSGWVTGFLAMKIGKAAATAIGGGIILLQIANHQGYIKINWSRLQRDMDTVTTKIQEVKANTEQKKNWTEKLEKKLEKMADKAESVVGRLESRSQRWYDKMLGRESRDLRIFLSSFAVGTTIGVITGG